MKKTILLAIFFTFLVVLVFIFFGIAQAGEVPDGFAGIPWGASRNQIIKAMNERGCQQITNNNPETLEFHKGNFAGVTCSRLYFNLRENSLYEGSAYGCARSEYHEFTQDKFNQIVKMLSGKYGPPKRGSEIRRGEDTVNKNYCAGLKLTFDFADWDLVDSRSNKYSIRMMKVDSTFYTFDGSERDACRMDFSISYSAESLKQQLGKKGY